MKFISILLSIIIYTAAFAGDPCEKYSYSIATDGFLCGGQSTGSICVVTNADGECRDQDNSYSVFISFPTDAFQLVNLGNSPFTVFMETGGMTTITANVDPPSDGDGEFCFEGNLLVPGTIFTTHIEAVAFPGIVISPNSFTIGTTNSVVGANVGIPTLSLAIALGMVLPPSLSGSASQQWIIEGAFEIDVEYALVPNFFGGAYNEIIVMPGGSIQVKKNFALNRTDVHGCNADWDRIRVYSGARLYCRKAQIRDAYVGVELFDNAELSLFEAQFIDNEYGIASFGSAPKNINIGVLNLGFVFNNVIANGKTGIHLENTNTQTLNGISVKAMSDNGIYLSNSDLNIKSSWIRDCYYGIHSLGSGLLTVNNCEFDKGDRGIFAHGVQELQVTDNTRFSNVGTAIFRYNESTNEHLLVENSQFDLTCGIDIGSNGWPSSAEIHTNQLNAEKLNIGIVGLTAGAYPWNIYNNFGMVAGFDNNIGQNISLTNTRSVTIHDNDYPTASLFNFHIEGGQGNAISSNADIISYSKNIEVLGSPLTSIACNKRFDALENIHIKGECAGSNITNNSMTAQNENLIYGEIDDSYANSGPQPFKNNRFDPSTPDNIKARNFSTQSVAMANQYKVGSLGLPIQGESIFPFFESEFSGWFTAVPGSPMAECAKDNPPQGESLKKGIESIIGVLESGLDIGYEPEVVFDSELKLHRILVELNDLEGLDPNMARWLDRTGGKGVAEIVAFEKTLNGYIELNETEKSAFTTFSEEISLAAAEIFEHEATPDETGNYTFTQSKAAQLRQQQAVDGIKNIVLPKHQALLAKLDELRAMLEAIPENALRPANNIKKANLLMLFRIDPRFKGYDKQQVEDLKALAAECPNLGGEGVFVAKSLLMELQGQLIWHDSSNHCAPQKPVSGRTQGDQKSNGQWAKVIPNPASETTMVTFDQASEGGRLWVANMQGQIVYSEEIAPGSTAHYLQLNHFSAGLYQVTIPGNTVPVKLVIVH